MAKNPTNDLKEFARGMAPDDVVDLAAIQEALGLQRASHNGLRTIIGRLGIVPRRVRVLRAWKHAFSMDDAKRIIAAYYGETE